jgi:hypothetical protein
MARNGNAGSFGVNGRKGGRPAGVPNKVTSTLKDMILKALENKGGVDYLMTQADQNPNAFLALVGRVLPLQVSGDPDAPLIPQRIEFVFRQAPGSDNRT